MLKFLFDFRKVFFSTKSISRYFIYALGEIILVVIGILIAVKINKVYQQRQNKNLESKYIQRFIHDLEIDINLYSETIDAINTNRRSVIAILNCYKYKKELSDSLMIVHLSQCLMTVPLTQKRSTIKDMESSGKLNLITSDSIRLMITDYYFAALKAYRQYNENNDYIKNKINGSRLLIRYIDFNSISNNSNMFSPNMKSVEVTPLKELPFLNDINSPDRHECINLFSAKSWLEGMNQNFILNIRKEALGLKVNLEKYNKTLHPN